MLARTSVKPGALGLGELEDSRALGPMSDALSRDDKPRGGHDRGLGTRGNRREGPNQTFVARADRSGAGSAPDGGVGTGRERERMSGRGRGVVEPRD